MRTIRAFIVVFLAIVGAHIEFVWAIRRVGDQALVTQKVSDGVRGRTVKRYLIKLSDPALFDKWISVD